MIIFHPIISGINIMGQLPIPQATRFTLPGGLTALHVMSYHLWRWGRDKMIGTRMFIQPWLAKRKLLSVSI